MIDEMIIISSVFSLIFLLLILHEFGHYLITYIIKGWENDIEFRWYGMRNHNKRLQTLKVYEYIPIILGGFAFNSIFAVNWFWLIIILSFCAFDFLIFTLLIYCGIILGFDTRLDNITFDGGAKWKIRKIL